MVCGAERVDAAPDARLTSQGYRATIECVGWEARTLKVGLFLAASSATACHGRTPQPVSLDAVLVDARANEVAALEKWEDEPVEIEGVVEKFGLQRVTKLRAEHSWHFHESTLERDRVRVPYILLLPKKRKLGKLVCLIPEDERQQLLPLREGERLTVAGILTDFHPTDDGFVVVLNPCGVAEPD